MNAERLTPILNVSNIQKSFSWFEKLAGRRRGNGALRPTLGASAAANAKSSSV